MHRNMVGEALEWLKLNHEDYCDLNIAYDNLKAYPDSGPPVMATYRSAMTNKNPEAVSAFDNEDEEGADSGPCLFVVNGIMGEKLNTMGPKALTAKVVKHLKEDNGRILAISHSNKPESMYDNPQLYPTMFPWLFPYGLGSISHIEWLSDMMHKRKLLMYHNKCFQMDALQVTQSALLVEVHNIFPLWFLLREGLITSGYLCCPTISKNILG